MRVAFYAPLKSPDHPTPSGDRTMARALVRALAAGGHEIDQPSGFRSFMPAPDHERAAAVAAEAQREITRIAATWESRTAPDLWFTYHNYYKAPDLLGPELSHRYLIPYVVAEASHAPRRAELWSRWSAAADAASRAADRHLCFTKRDARGLETLLGSDAACIDFPPFVDLTDLPVPPAVSRTGPPHLVTVAMMRPGDKAQSYRLLAQALALLEGVDWRMSIVGDGPIRNEVRSAFAALGANRVTWIGELKRAQLAAVLNEADLFVWPGFGEAFGLAYLEAQACGVPVLALDTAGVSSVVVHDRTGVLVSEATPEAYAEALQALLRDPGRRRRLGRAALAFAREDRALEQAAAHLDRILGGLRKTRAPARD